jgi:CubicO group peptidase (beta-lactamase class C family)
MINANLLDIIERYERERDFSGVCLVKQGDVEIVHEARGLAHRGFGVPNTIETRFDVASVTKLFTAAAVMQLVDRGQLTLDTPLLPYLGVEAPHISPDVTLYHALTHSSGIGDDADEEAGEDYELLFIDTPNYSIRETRDFIPQCTCREASFPPGQSVRYNNCAFVLTGLVIEAVTGMSYRDYIREHVFRPAGMTQSDFCEMDGVCANMAEHYKWVEHDGDRGEWRKNIYSYPPIGSPDGGATITAADLERFYRAVREHRLMSPEASVHLMTPQVMRSNPEDWPPGFAFGFEVDLDESGAVVKIGKEGMNAGVCSMSAYYPPSDTTIIALANQHCNVWAMVGEIEKENGKYEIGDGT